MVSGLPRCDVTVPARVAAMAEGRPVRAVWQNELGGLTHQALGIEGALELLAPASYGNSDPDSSISSAGSR